MQKFLIFLCIPLIFLFGGCTNTTENFSEQVKMEVKHIESKEGNKTIDITYPSVGGLKDSRTLATINNSISNYVEIQEKEFNSALNQDKVSDPITENFDATVTKQITEPVPADEETHALDEDGNPIEATDDEENVDKDTGEDNTDNKNAGDEKTDGETSSKSGTAISLTMNFEITYHKNNILNIVETYEKVLGGDKTYVGQQSFVFDLEKGLPVTLGDLFDFTGDFPTTVNSEINSQIKNNSSMLLYNDKSGFSGISKDANYYLDENSGGIYIFYNALEISPEKTLMPTFEFQLKKLVPYLNEDYTKVGN